MDDHTSVRSFFAEFRERLEDTFEMALAGFKNPGGTKTAIRVYDKDEKVTNLVQEYERLESGAEKFLPKYEEALRKRSPLVVRFIYTPLFSWRFKAIKKRQEVIRSNIFAYVIDYLKHSMSETSKVGVEQLDRSFRFAQHAEMLELIQLAEKEKPMLVFVFAFDNLLADKVLSRGHIIL